MWLPNSLSSCASRYHRTRFFFDGVAVGGGSEHQQQEDQQQQENGDLLIQWSELGELSQAWSLMG
jgi:hypothetical protein